MQQKTMWIRGLAHGLNFEENDTTKNHQIWIVSEKILNYKIGKPYFNKSF